MTSLALHVLRLAAVAALLLYLGHPLRRLLLPRRPDGMGVEACVAGLAVLTGFGWYWSTFSRSGMRAGLPVLLLACAPLWVVVLARRSKGTGREVLSLVAPAVIAVALFSLHNPQYFAHHAPGPVSFANNDVAFYNLAAQHLETAGFENHGKVTSEHLGRWTRRDITGTFLLMAGSAAVAGEEVWKMSVPVQTFSLTLTVAALAQFLRRLGGRGQWRWLAVAGIVGASGTFFYSLYQTFTAQLLAVAVTLALASMAFDIAASADGRLDRRIVGGQVALVALGEAALVMVYPHMAFLTVPVVIAFGVAWRLGASGSARSFLRTSVRSTVVILLGVMAAVLLLLPRYAVALRITTGIGDAVAGWPLGRVHLAQMLGLASFPDPPSYRPVSSLAPGPNGVVAIALVVAATAFVAAAVRRHPPGPARARLVSLAAAGILPIVVYAVLRLRYGETYQAWKGALFFQPLAPASLLAASLLAATFAQRRRGPVAAKLAAAGLLVVWSAATVAAATPWRNRPSLTVSDDLRGLAGVGERFRLTSVNVDIEGPLQYWGTMWAAYFLDGVAVHPLNETYLAPSPPRSEWTLRLDGAPVPAGAQRRVVNGTFVLDRGAAPAGP